MKLKKLFLLVPFVALAGCSTSPSSGGGNDQLKHEEGEKLVSYFQEKLGNKDWRIPKIDSYSDAEYNREKVQLSFTKNNLYSEAGPVDGYEYSISLESSDDGDERYNYWSLSYTFASEKTMENHSQVYARNKWAGGAVGYAPSYNVTINNVTFSGKKVSDITFEKQLDKSVEVVAKERITYMIDSFSYYCIQENLVLSIFE